MKLCELLKTGYSILKQAGIPEYHTDAQLILSDTVNKDRLHILTNPDESISAERQNTYLEKLRKRAEGCPLAYIINECEFYSLNFYVDENVLIPRNDTGVLVERAINRIGDSNAKIIEIGTGTGIIAVSIASNCKNAKLISTDINPAALDIARKNASLNRTAAFFRTGDVFEALSEDDFPADFIISNPPYIETAVIETLDFSVKGFEPKQALDGGFDGLYFYRKIISEANKYLTDDGVVLLEIGSGQAEAVKNILTTHGFTDITVIKDTFMRDRVIEARKPYV